MRTRRGTSGSRSYQNNGGNRTGLGFQAGSTGEGVMSRGSAVEGCTLSRKRSPKSPIVWKIKRARDFFMDESEIILANLETSKERRKEGSNELLDWNYPSKSSKSTTKRSVVIG